MTLDALSEAKEQRQRYEQAKERLEQEIRKLATNLTGTQDCQFGNSTSGICIFIRVSSDSLF